jgi:hypothetical protein
MDFCMANRMFNMNSPNRGGWIYNFDHELALTNCIILSTDSATYGMALAFNSWNSQYTTKIAITFRMIRDIEYEIMEQ